MDDKAFKAMFEEMEKRIAAAITARPPKNELIPIGEYDGEELLPGCYVLDDSYVVYADVAIWRNNKFI